MFVVFFCFAAIIVVVLAIVACVDSVHMIEALPDYFRTVTVETVSVVIAKTEEIKRERVSSNLGRKICFCKIPNAEFAQQKKKHTNSD